MMAFGGERDMKGTFLFICPILGMGRPSQEHPDGVSHTTAYHTHHDLTSEIRRARGRFAFTRK